MLVKLGETVQLAPAEAPSRSMFLPLNQDVVKTEADIVKSQVVISEAVKRLGIEPEPGTDMDQLLAAMQLATTVTQNPGGNILQINFLGRDPKRAARIVNTITDVYLEHHNKVYGKTGMSDFYSDQLVTLEGQMNVAERRLKQFLARNGIVDAETEIKLLTADEIEQDKGLQAHLAKISALREKLRTIQGQLDKTPEQIAWGREYTTNPTTLTYKNKLAELEVSRANVLQRYLPNDRHVRDFDEQIGNIKGRLSSEQDKMLSKTTMRTSLLNMDLKRSIFSIEALLADARARKPDAVAPPEGDAEAAEDAAAAELPGGEPAGSGRPEEVRLRAVLEEARGGARRRGDGQPEHGERQRGRPGRAATRPAESALDPARSSDSSAAWRSAPPPRWPSSS